MLERSEREEGGTSPSERFTRSASQYTSARRRCRDVGWLVLFAIAWVAMIALAAAASQGEHLLPCLPTPVAGAHAILTAGDLAMLYSGVDEDGHVCGSTRGHADLASRPYLYYGCLQYGRRHPPRVCVSSCPKMSGAYVRWYNNSIVQCELHGNQIPATTYPSTPLGHDCVPSAPSLYALVASRIDAPPVTSVVAGIGRALPVTAIAALTATALGALFVRSVRRLRGGGALAAAVVTASQVRPPAAPLHVGALRAVLARCVG